MIISPSLLAAPSLTLYQSIEKMLSLGFTQFHIDIMDHHFTKSLGLSPKHCEDILRYFPEVTLDVHLMMDPTPIELIEHLQSLNITDISIHPKTFSHPHTKLRAALCPNETILPKNKQLLFLTVTPGFSFQTMQNEVLTRASIAKQKGHNITIDGGVNIDNIEQVIAIQPDNIVIGGGLFGQNSKQLILRLKDLLS